MSVPIPQPPALPLLGNVLDIDPGNAALSLQHLSEKYGEIFQLNILGRTSYFVGSVELLNEICDEKRFHKSINPSLEQVRNGIGDGLFTAHHGSHDWEIAHRTLIPSFGPLGINHMYDEMYDIATQLVAKWARQEGETINVTDDFTRLTLDSIALCAMDKRFNSFYTQNMHPFVDAMSGFLIESGKRARRTRIEAMFSGKANAQYEAEIATMKQVAKEVMDRRRANPSDKKDLLQAMLFGKDPKTGERLSDENIMNNMITFLIAGHETTSGLLSFACYFMLKNPEVLLKAQHEVDTVVGNGPIKFQHMSKLPYIEAILRETLRLQPTAPAFTVEPYSSSQILAGKYHIPKGANIVAVLLACGRDPAVYGADADEFKPDRMMGDNFAKLPPNAWKPFGNGARGCIGRPFAWQEAVLALALVLQNFDLRMADPSYQLRVKTTLTIKPDGFQMKASLRKGVDAIQLERKMYAGLAEKVDEPKQSSPIAENATKPMTILYGSNSGTCEGLAQSLAGNAAAHGYNASVTSMDSAVQHLPKNQPVIVITASYEGHPPDNANSFVEWLKKRTELLDINYAVFGCGHRDWAATFQKVPKLVDEQLASKGASRIAERGMSDVAAGTIFDDFDQWQDNHLWPAISNQESNRHLEGLDLEISTSTRASHLRHNVQDAVVVSNEILTAPGTPVKRHMKIKLPTNMTYEAGDYLAVLPMNSIETVSRVLRRFSLPWDATMTLKKGSHTTIPTDHELSVASVLASYVEISTPATKKAIAIITTLALGSSTIDTSGTPSILDILEANPTITIPFSIFLSLLPPMRIRQYSISSSPLTNPSSASITYSLANSTSDDKHPGVATSHLSSLLPSSILHVAVKKSHASFHLPLDSATPVIMICAGTGLAPFRGFIEERVARITASPAAKNEMGDALLFIGCRSPDADALFSSELERWAEMGAVKIFYAYSQSPAQSENCKYVQDRLWREREVARKLFNEGARAYICGSGKVGKGVSEVVAKMVVEGAEREGKERTVEEATKWWEGLRGERYAVDVFD